MTTSTRSSQNPHPAYRCARASGVFLGIAMASSLVATPVAQASASTAPSSAGICGKVSTASVSAIVGYRLPAPTAGTIDLKATKQNDEISSVQTSCTYGAGTLAALPKDVVLDYGVTSRPLTAADLEKGLSQAQKLKITFVPYQGLGMPAYYYSFSLGAINVQGISWHRRGARVRGGRLYQGHAQVEARCVGAVSGETLSLPARQRSGGALGTREMARLEVRMASPSGTARPRCPSPAYWNMTTLRPLAEAVTATGSEVFVATQKVTGPQLMLV